SVPLSPPGGAPRPPAPPPPPPRASRPAPARAAPRPPAGGAPRARPAPPRAPRAARGRAPPARARRAPRRSRRAGSRPPGRRPRRETARGDRRTPARRPARAGRGSRAPRRARSARGRSPTPAPPAARARARPRSPRCRCRGRGSAAPPAPGGAPSPPPAPSRVAGRARGDPPRREATRTRARRRCTGAARALRGGRRARRSPGPPSPAAGAAPRRPGRRASCRARARAAPRRRRAAPARRPPPGGRSPPRARRPPSPGPPLHPSAGRRQRLGLLARHQRVHDRVDLAVQHAVQGVEGHVDPVVGHPALGEVVGADLLRAVARADHGLAVGGDLALLLAARALEKPRAQDLERLRLVLVLRLLVLTGDDEPRRQVRHAHGGEEARLVAARAGTDLEHRVALVIGVLGEEEVLEGRVERGQTRLERGQLAARQLAQLGVLLAHELAVLLDLARQALALAPAGDRLLELRPFPGELGELAPVGDDGRVRDQALQLLVASLDLGEAVEHRLTQQRGGSASPTPRIRRAGDP